MSKRNVVIVGLLLVIGLLLFDSGQPKRPFLHWLGGTIRTILPLAPLVFEEPPAAEMRYSMPPAQYSEPPVRPVGTDNFEVVSHGEGW